MWLADNSVTKIDIKKESPNITKTSLFKYIENFISKN